MAIAKLVFEDKGDVIDICTENAFRDSPTLAQEAAREFFNMIRDKFKQSQFEKEWYEEIKRLTAKLKVHREVGNESEDEVLKLQTRNDQLEKQIRQFGKDLVFHTCTGGVIRPYSTLLCSCCVASHGSNFNVLERIGELKAKLEKRIKELEERERKLNALEVAGVDNWEGYDIAMDILSEEDGAK